MTEKGVYMTKQADDIRLLPNDLQSLQFTLPFRTDEGAKQDFGRAVIVGGSASFVGAPCFAAESAAEVLALAGEAAMRSGAGTTVLALPDILLPALYPHLRYSAAFALPSGKAAFARFPESPPVASGPFEVSAFARREVFGGYIGTRCPSRGELNVGKFAQIDLFRFILRFIFLFGHLL